MFLSGRGGLTGGAVIPSGSPPYALRQDHDAVKRRVTTSSLRERKCWLIKPGHRMLFSLGRRIVYERETRTRKPTQKLEHSANGAKWKCNAATSYGWIIQGPIVVVFCQWSPAGLAECRALCLKTVHPKRLVAIPSQGGGARLRRRKVSATGQKILINKTTRPHKIL